MVCKNISYATFGLALALLLPRLASADAILTILDESLDPGLSSGSVVVQIHSDAPLQEVGSFNLDLQLSAFTGNLAGQMVTINSVTANFGSFTPAPSVPVSLADGGTLVLSGFVLPADNDILGAGFKRDLFTINFALPAALASVNDTFTVGFEAGGQEVFDTNFANILGGTGTQLVSVPEPSSLLACLALGAGCLVRRRRRLV